MLAQQYGVHDSSVADALSTIDAIEPSSFKDEGSRTKALFAAYALVNRLEKPFETVNRFGMAIPAFAACIKIARDLKLFEVWAAEGDQPMTTQQLSELVTCDSVLLPRLLRHLAANNVIEEVGADTYKQTPRSLGFKEPGLTSWIDYQFDALIPSFANMPKFLAERNYVNPANAEDCVFSFAKGWEGGIFNYYDHHPEESKTFNDMMGAVTAKQVSWLDIYAHNELLKAGTKDPLKETSPILVDVGGSRGGDLERFREAHPELAPRLVLQDRGSVVAESILPEAVVKQDHDFFKEQPVKGARAFYLHSILHDWPDDKCVEILKQLAAASTAGYTKLLIHEHVLPDTNNTPQSTSYDLLMLVLNSAMERTETMWSNLLAAGGFKVVKVWREEFGTPAVIEAELA